MNILDVLKKRVLIADGAMGTQIQGRYLTPDDFRGLDGCNEYLVITRPEIIRDIHRGYLEVGADIIETNSFGSSKFVLAEYGLGELSFEISRTAAALAKEVASEFTT